MQQKRKVNVNFSHFVITQKVLHMDLAFHVFIRLFKKAHTFLEFTILVNIYQERSVIFPDSFSLDP